MAQDYYFPFDYFSTNSREYIYKWEELDNYGISKEEVYEYLEIMEEDRKKWRMKKDTLELRSQLLQILVSILIIPLVVVFVKIPLDALFGIHDKNSYADDIITTLVGAIIIWMEYIIWKDSTIINIVLDWGKRKYRIKSVNNSIIEKYLSDCHWEYYQQCNETQQKHNNLNNM